MFHIQVIFLRENSFIMHKVAFYFGATVAAISHLGFMQREQLAGVIILINIPRSYGIIVCNVLPYFLANNCTDGNIKGNVTGF